MEQPISLAIHLPPGRPNYDHQNYLLMGTHTPPGQYCPPPPEYDSRLDIASEAPTRVGSHETSGNSLVSASASSAATSVTSAGGFLSSSGAGTTPTSAGSSGKGSGQLLTPPSSPTADIDEELESHFRRMCEEAMSVHKVHIILLRSWQQASTPTQPLQSQEQVRPSSTMTTTTTAPALPEASVVQVTQGQNLSGYPTQSPGAPGGISPTSLLSRGQDSPAFRIASNTLPSTTMASGSAPTANTAASGRPPGTSPTSAASPHVGPVRTGAGSSWAYTLCITGEMQQVLQARSSILRANPTKISEKLNIKRSLLLQSNGELKAGLRASINEIMAETGTRVAILGSGSSSVTPIVHPVSHVSVSAAQGSSSGFLAQQLHSSSSSLSCSQSHGFLPQTASLSRGSSADRTGDGPGRSSDANLSGCFRSPHQFVPVEVVGTPLQVDAARIALLASIDRASSLFVDTLELDSKLHYVVAGRKHEELHQIMRSTGTNIYIPNPLSSCFSLPRNVYSEELPSAQSTSSLTRPQLGPYHVPSSAPLYDFPPSGQQCGHSYQQLVSLATPRTPGYPSHPGQTGSFDQLLAERQTRDVARLISPSNIVISGEQNDVLKAKEHLSTLACGKSLRAETITVTPRKIDWMIVNKRDSLLQIMRDNGTFVSLPALGSFSSLLTVYGDNPVYIKRTIRMISRLSCECYIASLRLANPGYPLYLDHGYQYHQPEQPTCHSPLNPQDSQRPYVADVIARVAQASGSELLYNNSFIDIYGPEACVTVAYQRLAQLEGSKFSHQEAKFQVELAKEHREFISGKKNGKINKIIRSTGVKISCEDTNEYNMLVEVLSVYQDRAFEAFNLLRGELPAEISFHVPESYHKRIIGVGGRNIQRIMKRYGVFVKFSNVDEHHQLGGYFSNHDNVIARTPVKNASNLRFLEEAVLELVYPKDRHVSHNTAVIPINFHRLLEHKAAEIEAATDVKIEFPNRESGCEAILVTGHGPNIMGAVQLLLEYAPEDFELRISTGASAVNSLLLSQQFKQVVVHQIQRELGIAVLTRANHGLFHQPPTLADQTGGSFEVKVIFRCPRKRVKYLDEAKQIVLDFLRSNGIRLSLPEVSGCTAESVMTISASPHPTTRPVDGSSSAAMNSFKHFHSKILAVSTGAGSETSSRAPSPIVGQAPHNQCVSYTWFPQKNELHRGRLASSAPNLRAIFSRNLFSESAETLPSKQANQSPLLRRKHSAVLEGECGFRLPRSPSSSSLVSASASAAVIGGPPGLVRQESFDLNSYETSSAFNNQEYVTMNGFANLSISSQMPEGLIQDLDPVSGLRGTFQQSPGGAPKYLQETGAQFSSSAGLDSVSRILRQESEYSNGGLKALLEELDMTKYLEVFIEQEVDFEMLLTLNDGDLRELGVTTFGSRRKLLNALKRIRNSGQGVPWSRADEGHIPTVACSSAHVPTIPTSPQRESHAHPQSSSQQPPPRLSKVVQPPKRSILRNAKTLAGPPFIVGGHPYGTCKSPANGSAVALKSPTSAATSLSAASAPQR